MLYLYNNSTEVYRDLYRQAFENWHEYMDGDTDDLTAYEIMFVMGLDDIFTEAKRRTSLRGRFAKGKEGGSLLETIAMTDDERDFFDSIMPNGSAEVFKKMLAFSKEVNNAHQFNVSFGAKLIEGSITAISSDLAVITDSAQSLTPNALTGQRLVITTAGDYENLERDITGNTATTISLAEPFQADLTDLEYAVYNPAEKFVIYSVRLDLNWEFNMLANVEAAVKEALILYAIKEWYLTNRYMDDHSIEETRYQQELTKIRSGLIQQRTITRRPTDQFSV